MPNDMVPSLTMPEDMLSLEEESLAPAPRLAQKKGWEDLNWKEKKKENHGWFLHFLTLEAKLETLIYSLSSGLLAGALLIFILSFFSPLALVIISSLSLSGLSAWLMWSRWGENATLSQKFLLVLSALLVGVLFALLINFAAVPALGMAATLAGAGFLVAAANAALYLIIGMGITQLVLSAVSTWKANHQLASENVLKNAHSLAKALHLTKQAEIGPHYSLTEKLSLGYGLLISSAIGLTVGTLTYLAISQILPTALLSLGLGLSISGPVLVPLAITLCVVSALIISKQFMANFIKLANQNRELRLKPGHIPSLLEELLAKNEGIFFNQQPSLKIQRVFSAIWQAHFSYAQYWQYQKKHHADKVHLTPLEFRMRNFFNLTLLLPFTVMALVLNPLLSEEYKAELKKELSPFLFWRNPLRYSAQLITTTVTYLISYQSYKRRHPETEFSAQQFHIRNAILFFIIPLIVAAFVINLGASTLGSTQLIKLFNLSTATALTISTMSNAIFAACLSPLLLVLLGNCSKDAPLRKPEEPDPKPAPSAAIRGGTNLGAAPPINKALRELAKQARKAHFTPPEPPAQPGTPRASRTR